MTHLTTIENKMQRIAELKKMRNAIILSHFYTLPEVQEVADFIGDSLALAIEAKKTDAPVILFAGVHFMGETAKLLCKDKTVLLPCLEAGCSLADSCKAEDLKKFKEQNPDYTIVSYVNSSIDVKCHTDICCTSSNALKVIESISAEEPILFVPDKNLGGYLKQMTKRENMKLWDGFCHVHEAFDTSLIDSVLKTYPHAEIAVHPECKKEVVDMAHYVGSTAGIINYCSSSDCDTFIIVTEQGILSELKRLLPNKRLIALDLMNPEDCSISTNSKRTQRCAVCEYMKMITLDNIIETLETMTPEVKLDDNTYNEASGCIERMLNI